MCDNSMLSSVLLRFSRCFYPRYTRQPTVAPADPYYSAHPAHQLNEQDHDSQLVHNFSASLPYESDLSQGRTGLSLAPSSSSRTHTRRQLWKVTSILWLRKASCTFALSTNATHAPDSSFMISPTTALFHVPESSNQSQSVETDKFPAIENMQNSSGDRPENKSSLAGWLADTVRGRE